MLIATTTLTGLVASLSEVSVPTFTAVLPYVLLAIAVPLTFYTIRRLIGFLPKGK